MHPPLTFQQPLGPATISTSFTSTASPSSTYEHYRADNIYSPNTAAAQPRTTSTFDYTPSAPAQPGHAAPQRPPLNNPYRQPPPYAANAYENAHADLELEFALQISLADYEEEQREETRILARALEESRRDPYLY